MTDDLRLPEPSSSKTSRIPCPFHPLHLIDKDEGVTVHEGGENGENLGEPNFSIPLINWGKEVVEESRMMEKTPREDLMTTFHRIQRPLWDTESPPKPKLYPPPIPSFFMNGTGNGHDKEKRENDQNLLHQMA